MAKIILSKNAPAPIGPYSQAVQVDGTLYCSGQIPLDPTANTIAGDDIVTQTKMVFRNISAVLEAAGMSFDNVVKTTCFLTSMDDFAAFNDVYAEHFTGEIKPARSTVEVSRLPKDVLVEIEVIAR